MKSYYARFKDVESLEFLKSKFATTRLYNCVGQTLENVSGTHYRCQPLITIDDLINADDEMLLRTVRNFGKGTLKELRALLGVDGTGVIIKKEHAQLKGVRKMITEKLFKVDILEEQIKTLRSIERLLGKS